jgi:hypothetical protein
MPAFEPACPGDIAPLTSPIGFVPPNPAPAPPPCYPETSR